MHINGNSAMGNEERNKAVINTSGKKLQTAQPDAQGLVTCQHGQGTFRNLGGIICHTTECVRN